MVKIKKLNLHINLNPFSLFESLIPSEKKTSKKAGLPPGSLVYVGPKRDKQTKIAVIDYDEEHFEERDILKIEDCECYKDKKTVTWINIDGLEQVEIIEKIDNYFDIHPLVAEDILNTGQRPKVEDYDDYIFVCMKMITLNQDKKKVISEHVSFLVGLDYVLTFQEAEGDVFNIIRDRIREAKGRIRTMGPDYLMYSLLDAIIDNYFVVLENLSEKIETLEEEILGELNADVAKKIHLLKRDMIYLRRQIWPLREIVSGLQRTESKLITKETSYYLRDAYDHTIQAIDTLESQRDMTSGLHDVYLSTISNRMNEVMKVLTIFASIFIPLTFIAGIYGMNFDYMPELHWEWGYFGVLGLMGFLGLFMLIYFKFKKWL